MRGVPTVTRIDQECTAVSVTESPSSGSMRGRSAAEVRPETGCSDVSAQRAPPAGVLRIGPGTEMSGNPANSMEPLTDLNQILATQPHQTVLFFFFGRSARPWSLALTAVSMAGGSHVRSNQTDWHGADISRLGSWVTLWLLVQPVDFHGFWHVSGSLRDGSLDTGDDRAAACPIGFLGRLLRWSAS
jgi:hypothetical protein